MAAADNLAVGPGVTLHRADLLTTVSETTIETALTASNLVGNVEAITPPVETRETYDRMPLGSDNTIPIPGRISLGELSFSIYFDASNAMHTAIRDDDKRTIRSYIFTLNEPGSVDATYCHVQGFVTVANIEELADNQIMANVTVMLTDNATWVDNS